MSTIERSLTTPTREHPPAPTGAPPAGEVSQAHTGNGPVRSRKRARRFAVPVLVAFGLLAAGCEPAPQQPGQGLWVSGSELAALPTSGAAWDQIRNDAASSWGTALISDQESNHDVKTLAGALYAARTNDGNMRNRVVQAIESAIGTEDGGRTLALGRNLPGYVIAADLVGYRTPRFEDWLRGVRHENLDGMTLVSTHERRPNNWGTHAGAARIAVARYLNDTTDLNRAATVFRGFVGERAAYAGFSYGDLTWQSDPARPVGINPAGAVRNGFNVDGVLGDDQRRCVCAITNPPAQENYVWEALQGSIVQARLLSRAGFPAWQWGQQGHLRAVRWLHDQARFPATGDDGWIPAVVNQAYGTQFPSTSTPQQGKNMGYTGWITGR